MIKEMKKIWKSIKNYFTRSWMSDEEWGVYLKMKRNPIYMQYKNGCMYLCWDKKGEKPFRILRGKEIIWEAEQEQNIKQ